MACNLILALEAQLFEFGRQNRTLGQLKILYLAPTLLWFSPLQNSYNLHPCHLLRPKLFWQQIRRCHLSRPKISWLISKKNSNCRFFSMQMELFSSLLESSTIFFSISGFRFWPHSRLRNGQIPFCSSLINGFPKKKTSLFLRIGPRMTNKHRTENFQYYISRNSISSILRNISI